MNVTALAELLHETAEHHGPYEATAPEHNWWDWYAAYMVARENGRTPDEAAGDAARHMEPLLR
ncbi:bleomycin resistance protein [Streptomyces sp. NPDC002926]